MANKAHSTSDELKQIPYKLLQRITDDFDHSHILGSGVFGTVYKGVLNGGEEIAVKVFHMATILDDGQFHKELRNIWRLNHQNIVKLVGFCNESVEESFQFRVRTVLCLEYLHGGSLQDHISDENTGLNWHTRYKIIRGVCEGLHYLHEGLDSPVLHLDLNPYNILLDKNMVPKIEYFGLSSLFGEENKTGTCSMDTSGYYPPEYLRSNIISKEIDIFSLGVIILKTMTGHEGYNLIDEMRVGEFVDHVHDNWRSRLDKILSPRSLEAYCKQVKICIEIALDCIKWNRLERPTIEHIVSTLTQTEKFILDLGLPLEQFHEEEQILPKKNLQKRLSPEIVEDVSTNKSKESKPSILNEPPKELSFDLLKRITDDFSDKQRLGEDAFGTTYKGILQYGEVIVVKRLKENSPVTRVKVFINEIQNIMALRHDNIVRLVGYCTEGQRVVQKNGKYIVAESVESLLCYEHLNRGSLDKYVFGESSISDWYIRFNIIKGVCDGLLFLHKIPIIHMDIKPENVLLDHNMVPRIANFCMSRIIGEEQTQENTQNIVGSYGYMAPEYLYRGAISTQTDIYSLGLMIIEIVTIERNCRSSNEPSGRSFIDKVREKWTYDHIISVHPSVDDISLRQIKACIEIGLQCVEIDWKKRPSTENIVNMISDIFHC